MKAVGRERLDSAPDRSATVPILRASSDRDSSQSPVTCYVAGDRDCGSLTLSSLTGLVFSVARHTDVAAFARG
jgi:hypothetical protein